MSVQLEADGGLDYLEKKLGIFIQGPSQTRRNAALDILTGRVPDERLLAAEAVKPPASQPVPPAPTGIHPNGGSRTPRAFRLASDALPAVDWTSRSSVSPWLAASDIQRARIRIAPPTPPTPAAASVLRVLLDERYTSYRLATSEVGQFVAVGIPRAQALGDTVVTGVFHKVGGPPGGGYGLILRDQNPGARDGRNQF